MNILYEKVSSLGIKVLLDGSEEMKFTQVILIGTHNVLSTH